MTHADTNGDQWAGTTAPITVCGDGSYCCGVNNSAYPEANPNGPECCSAGQGRKIVDGKIALTYPNKSTSTQSILHTSSDTSITSSPSHATSPTYSSTPQLEKSTTSNHKDMIVGGVVGGIAGLMLIVLAFRCLIAKWSRKRVRKSPRGSTSGDRPKPLDMDPVCEIEAPMNPTSVGRAELTSKWIFEIPEKSATPEKSELDARWIRELDCLGH